VSSLNGLERYLKSRAPDPDDASPSLAIDPARWYRPPPQRQLRSILSHGPRVAVPRACAGHGAGDRHAHGRADLVGGLVAGLVVGLRIRHGGLVGGLRQVRTCASGPCASGQRVRLLRPHAPGWGRAPAGSKKLHANTPGCEQSHAHARRPRGVAWRTHPVASRGR
jgi:hypothetical protein